MKLLVIRHAIAEDQAEFAKTGKDDRERPLTKAGQRKMRKAAAGLKTLIDHIDIFASSALVRAVQTAGIISPKFDKIAVSQVQIRAVLPADSIVESANALVRAENELKTKEVEVQTAIKEAQRIAALNANAKAIDYMNAQANFMIAEGVKAGKVHTIVVPVDFKGIVQTPAVK